MLELVNRTPHAVALIPFSDVEGHNRAGVVIKGTWAVAPGAEPALADEQQPVLRCDLRNGDAPQASLRYAADLGWPKPATDVALVGHAYAPRARSTEVDVGLTVGRVRKVVRVVGDRAWYRSIASWQITKPRPFEKIPLAYEQAYGGRDATDPRREQWEPRNPVGKGFVAAAVRERLEGLLLPNLEDPGRPISSWKDRPVPAGFGFIDSSWAPRAQLAGTYDANWEAERAPLLPEDFDERFMNAAHPDLVARGHLAGGEPVLVTNADPTGRLDFRLPRRKFTVTAVVEGRTVSADPSLDTVWIDADARLLVIVWRTAFPAPRCLAAIRAVFVKEASS